MNDKETVRTSKFLSLILRHEPERVGLTLGEAGWVGVKELLKAVNGHGVALTLAFLLRNGVAIVAEPEEIAGLGIAVARGEVYAGMLAMWMREAARSMGP